MLIAGRKEVLSFAAKAAAPAPPVDAVIIRPIASAAKRALLSPPKQPVITTMLPMKATRISTLINFFMDCKPLLVIGCLNANTKLCT
jgi:hypothetical protein